MYNLDLLQPPFLWLSLVLHQTTPTQNSDVKIIHFACHSVHMTTLLKCLLSQCQHKADEVELSLTPPGILYRYWNRVRMSPFCALPLATYVCLSRCTMEAWSGLWPLAMRMSVCAHWRQLPALCRLSAVSNGGGRIYIKNQSLLPKPL